MTILEKILDKFIPKRGLSKDELRAFKKSFIPNEKASTKIFARIERGEGYNDLCLRPADFPRFRYQLSSNGLANNDVIAEILVYLETNEGAVIRFRHGL